MDTLLTVLDKVLLMIEHQNLVEGIEHVTSDDVLTFLQYGISAGRAKSILTDLYRDGYVTRVKSQTKHKRGPKEKLYKIINKGKKRCEELRSQGYALGDN